MIRYIGHLKPNKKKIMKKTLAILVLALFIGGISAPVIASGHNSLTLISLQEDDPKKKSKSKKSENKAEKSTKATKSGDCTNEKKSDCTNEKKSDCTNEKRSDCSSKCEGES